MKRIIAALTLIVSALLAGQASPDTATAQGQPCSVTWLSTWSMRGVCTHGGSYHFQITCKLGSTYRTYSTAGTAPSPRTLNCSSSSWVISGYGIWT
jgi:hypothetical protein